MQPLIECSWYHLAIQPCFPRLPLSRPPVHHTQQITDTTASARALGVTAVTLYSVAALLALSLACLVLAHSGEVRLPLLRQLKLGACGISFDSSDDMAACAAWAQNISG